VIESIPSDGPTVVCVRFNGVVYRRYPKSRVAVARNYFQCVPKDRVRGCGLLHRAVWRYFNGPIPQDHEIHHVDANTLNNDPSNLECLSKTEHRKRHPINAYRRRGISWKKKNPDAYRIKDNWHRSEEGREYHRLKGREIMAKMPTVEKKCELCGSQYTTKYNISFTSKFCSPKCRGRARRLSGVDHVSITCRCGKTVMRDKYDKQTYCSKSCAAKFEAKGFIQSGEAWHKLRGGRVGTALARSA
jgi:hypothetical protein